MHKQLQSWKEQLSPEEWKRLRFVISATHSLDAGAGDYFFNDKQRLHRDILADDAEKIINNLFSK